MVRSFSLVVVLLLLPGPVQAQVDEPGASRLLEEPGLETPDLPETSIRAAVAPLKTPSFRLELAFGYASLLVDPDVAEGMGAGLYLAWGLRHRFGVELSGFFSGNPYDGYLGSYGTWFLSGNISLGPIVQLTRPGSRFMITLEAGIGTYVIVPLLQDNLWTLGFSGGLTIGYRIARWFGIGFKWRYHLFNVARLSGPEFRDLKAFQKVGVIDRMELPGYLAFYF